MSDLSKVFFLALAIISEALSQTLLIQVYINSSKNGRPTEVRSDMEVESGVKVDSRLEESLELRNGS